MTEMGLDMEDGEEIEEDMAIEDQIATVVREDVVPTEALVEVDEVCNESSIRWNLRARSKLTYQHDAQMLKETFFFLSNPFVVHKFQRWLSGLYNFSKAI